MAEQSLLATVASDVKQIKTELRELNGTVSGHDKWITIRTDREQQADERGENRNGWLKVLVGAAFAFAAAIITLLVTILTAGVPH